MREERQLSVVRGPLLKRHRAQHMQTKAIYKKPYALRYAVNKVNINCHGRLTTDNGRCGPFAIPKLLEFSEHDALGELLSTTVKLDFEWFIEQNCRL